MTIYVVKRGRGERKYLGSDDYEGEIFSTEWDVRVFDCKSKVIDYIYSAIKEENDNFYIQDDQFYTRNLSRERIETYQERSPIRYAAKLVYGRVEEEHFFTYQSYEVE